MLLSSICRHRFFYDHYHVCEYFFRVFILVCDIGGDVTGISFTELGVPKQENGYEKAEMLRLEARDLRRSFASTLPAAKAKYVIYSIS